jgi:hypothetical protein
VGLLNLRELAGLGQESESGNGSESPPAPPAPETIMCYPPCATEKREATVAQCEEWKSIASRVMCRAQVPTSDWIETPCYPGVPPDCYGRRKVRVQNCYEWVCPPGSSPTHSYAPAAHVSPSVRAQATQALAYELRLAEQQAQRRALLAAAQEAAAAATVAATAPVTAPSIAVGEPHPATPRPTRRRASRPAINSDNLLWLMAGAVIVLAIKR